MNDNRFLFVDYICIASDMRLTTNFVTASVSTRWTNTLQTGQHLLVTIFVSLSTFWKKKTRIPAS